MEGNKKVVRVSKLGQPSMMDPTAKVENTVESMTVEQYEHELVMKECQQVCTRASRRQPCRGVSVTQSLWTALVPSSLLIWHNDCLAAVPRQHGHGGWLPAHLPRIYPAARDHCYLRPVHSDQQADVQGARSRRCVSPRPPCFLARSAPLAASLVATAASREQPALGAAISSCWLWRPGVDKLVYDIDT